MYQTVERQLKKWDLLNKDKKLLLAISGGVDSMVLFDLIKRIPMNMRPFILIAHVNHNLRPEAEEEEHFVRHVAKQHQVPIFVHHWAPSAQPESGIEEAARNVRYAFFKQLIEQTEADAVLTAHHQDDQIETILMKLTRGSTLDQITGIEDIQTFHQSLLVRPLLPFSKDEIYHYAKNEQVDYIEDASNQTLSYSRNRFRNQIIPLLKEENQKFNEHMEQFAVDLKDLIQIADEPIQAAFTQLVTIHPTRMTFNLEAYFQLSDALQRAVLVEMMKTLYKGESKRYKVAYIGLIQEWLQTTEGNSQLDLTDGVTIQKAYNQISLQKNNSSPQTSDDTEAPSSFIIEANQPFVQLSETETIELAVVECKDSKEDTPHKKELSNQLVFHSEQIQFPLTIRHRQPGDRMTYKGLVGSKKIKDIFIDEKVPAKERDKVWLVEDATGRIIWLISYRKMYLLSEEETDKLTYILHYNNHKN